MSSLGVALAELDSTKDALQHEEYVNLKRKLFEKHLGVSPCLTDKESTLKYMKEQAVVAEVDAALKHLFEAKPPNAVSFLADYFTRKVQLSQRGRPQSAAPRHKQTRGTNLFERLGGETMMKTIVERFYDKVLDDNQVAHFFTGHLMSKQQDMQNKFLTKLFEGPDNYNGKTMQQAHKRLVSNMGLNDKHFDIMISLLRNVLTDANVLHDDVDRCISLVESTRTDVLCKDMKDEAPSLYERLGGCAALNATVENFYEKVLADSRVNGFFEGVDMKKQKQIQKAFLTFAFGGPNKYSGRNMRKAHEKLVKEKGLNDSHYDAIVDLLAETLSELGVSATEIKAVAAVANTVRDDILCKETGTPTPAANESQPEPPTLFERLGGAAAVDAAVDQFYEKVLADSRVKDFFEGVDMKKQRKMQKAFLTFAFGGPNKYSGHSMQKAHEKLVKEKGLNETHYNAIVELLAETLKELGVGDADIGEVAKVANSVKDDVLCKGMDLTPPSLFERLGGAAAVDAAVDQFYEKVLADSRVKDFFEGVDMNKQRKMQKAFLTFAFGGPNKYSGHSMQKAHEKLVKEKGLNDSHYDAIVELLGGTLKELGVGNADVDEVAKIANSVRDDVLCKELVAQAPSLFERLGGGAAVDAAVDKFYEKVLADSRVRDFFEGVDMNKQRKMQKAFLTFAFGGPNKYTGHSMQKAHEKLVKEKGLNETHYNVIVELLAETLRELGVSNTDIDEVAKVANSVKDDVLCKGMETPPLFERLGGGAAVDAAVDQFYEKVLADSRVKDFFEGVDMKKQKQMQKSFLTLAFGGPNKYSGRSMQKAHEKLVKEKGLNETHYNAIVELLAETLKELGVGDADIEEVAKIANSVKDDILCKGMDVTPPPLFERLGGEAAVDAAVDQFYEKVLADSRVKDFFEGVDMKKQRKMQKAFLTFAFGGLNKYSGHSMQKAHEKLVKEKGLNETHYDAIVELLAETLRELGVSNTDIDEVAKVANSVKDDILCKGMEQASLFSRLGGAAAVDSVVDLLYDVILEDDSLSKFFSPEVMPQLRKMQKDFLTFAFGGNPSYEGSSMRKAHKRAVSNGLSDVHFDKVANHITESMKELGVSKSDIEEVAKAVESLRDDILCKGEEGDLTTAGNLFERLGGEVAVDTTVGIFYDKVLKDSRVKDFFEGVDMKKQKQMQRAFLTFAFGGPNKYTGHSMQKAHEKLVKEKGLNETHYNVIVELLAETLRELGVSNTDIDEVAKVANSVKDDVLCKGAEVTAEAEGEPLIDVITEEGVERVVEKLFDKLMLNPDTQKFFSTVKMRKLKGLAVEYFVSAFGGDEYCGRNLRVAHEKVVSERGLNDASYNLFMKFFSESLTEENLSAAVVSRAVALAEDARGDVLCKPE